MTWEHCCSSISSKKYHKDMSLGLILSKEMWMSENASFLWTSRFLTGGGTGSTFLRQRRMVHLLIRATTYSPTSKRHWYRPRNFPFRTKVLTLDTQLFDNRPLPLKAIALSDEQFISNLTSLVGLFIRLLNDRHNIPSFRNSTIFSYTRLYSAPCRPLIKAVSISN